MPRPPRLLLLNRNSQTLRILLTLALALGMLLPLLPAPSAAAADPCAAPANKIVAENCQTGSPASEWDLGSVDSSQIEGFATDMSVDQGQTVRFKINTTATAYRIEIYRLGYYGGMGARRIGTIPNSATLKQRQPSCLSDPATGLVDCGNWTLSASWAVPANATSGVYVAKLVREDGVDGVNHAYFVVRDDDGASDLLFQTSDTTWQAYNSYGGASLYTNTAFSNGVNRAYKVSYNRPYNTRTVEQKNFLFNAEYPMIRFLERNGYDLSYASGVDTDRRGAAALTTHKAFLSVGHDEYWSAQQRANVEAAREAGVDLAFFSGNEVYWKTRWENAIDGSGTPYRTLVTYKETAANAKIDPSPEWTGTWRDPRFSPPYDGGRPENALTGAVFMVQNHQSPITVPAADGKLRFWRNTDIATLAAGQTASLGGANSSVLGFEWNEDRDNGARPAGLIRLSTTTANVNERLVDYGSTVAPGTATHNLTLYRQQTSRALVFGAGTIQWSWGLDAEHDRGPSTVDRRMQQATVNLLSDMSAPPATLQADLVPTVGGASTDVTAPTSTITAPSAGATVRVGTVVSVTGTAADAGGVVGGVEVSTDGGATWNPATGRESWSYSWTPETAGTITLKTRAVDDSGNVETAGAGLSVTVERVCPCTIWNDSAVPAVSSVNSPGSIELGVKFRSDVDGYITGVRFYKGAANTGTHVGKLWTSDGTLLASATFSGETASGWQRVNFASPVAITANTVYVASYVAPSGGYAADAYAFASAGEDSAPLHALADGAQGGNGLYLLGASGFPTSTYRSTNYWVDAVFTTTDTSPPVVTARSPAPNATGGSILPKVTVTFSEPVQPPSVVFQLRDAANALVAATVTYDDPTRTATLTPNGTLAEGVAYRARVSGATDIAGNVMTDSSTWTFTTATCPCSVWNDATTPASVFVNSQPLEVGVKLRSDVGGYITGLRFFKAATDPGTHVGNLWTGSGTLLASATFPSKDGSGCPCTVWDDTTTPAVASDPDTASIEVGVRFRSTAAGYITGLRFYKGPANTGTHVGKLWTSSGTLLASTTFAGETASGWQQVSFATPVAIQANTVYVASYVAPNGGYAQDTNYFFSSGKKRGPLEALEDGVSGRNGLYRLGSGFPNQTFNASNYWVDVVFSAGWQQVNFATPVAITANTTYVASQHSSAGHYVANPGYFAGAGASFGPLRALADGVDGPQGVYKEGPTGFPIYGGGGGNYLVDAVFSQTPPADTTPPTLVGRAPAANAVGTPLLPAVTATFSEAIDPSSLVFELRDGAGAPVAASLSYDDPSRTATLTPGAALAQGATYRASVTARDAAGNAMAAPDAWTFTTVGCPCSLWNDASAPASAFVNARPLELGLKFRSEVNGYITGLRFYKTAGDTGTHLANLWRSDGTPLATAIFVGETASGWQQVGFASPVAVAANTTYVASYHSSAGYYGATQGYFAASATRSGPLLGLANGADGPNGSFREGSSGFPDLSAGGSNYWVDVVFDTSLPADTTPPTVLVRSPAVNAADVGLRPAIKATFSEAVQAASIAFVLRDAAGNPVASSLSYDDPSRTATLTPNVGLAPGATYTASVSATDSAGNAMASPDSWSFATPTCPCSLWSDAATPSLASVGDSTPIELGLQFRVETAGYIGGVRFYKGTGNAGTHVGKLWSSTGTLLASATFGGETASGWQQVSFATPVAVQPGVTYVASYVAPLGGYSYDGGYFGAAGREVGPLRALSGGESGGNGVYRYGSSGFPSQSYNNANYWVDPVFTTSPPPDTTAPTVVARSPAPNANSVGLSASVTATFSEAVSAGSIVFELRDGANAVVPASVSYDATSLTARLAPTDPLVPGTYTARVSGATDAAGNAMAGTDTWSFSTPTCPCSLWNDATTPTTASAGDTSSIELGVKFRSSAPGYVTGVRFYKGSANTGTHVANLWASDGTLLASAVFTNETATGWQQVSFAAPVAISANTAYIASYHAPTGGYAYDGGYFGGAYQSGPLSALADAEGGNGLYRYGGSGFPSQSYGATNYWVDVVYGTAAP